MMRSVRSNRNRSYDSRKIEKMKTITIAVAVVFIFAVGAVNSAKAQSFYNREKAFSFGDARQDLAGKSTKQIVGLLTPTLNVAYAWNVTALPQPTPDQPLNEQQVSQLLEQLENSLKGDVDDEDEVAAILERWENHEDLVGKTRTQILQLFFNDVRAVITDQETRDTIWSNWTKPAAKQGQTNTTVQPTVQGKQEPKLSDEDVDLLIADLAEMLDDMLSDRAAIGAIVSRWYNRTGLAGRTESQVMLILFEDVKAVITNKAAQDDIWAYWTESDGDETDGREQTVLQAPVKTEEQKSAQVEMKDLVKGILENVKQNRAVFNQIFSVLRMDNEYEPERLAGLCYFLLDDDTKCKSLATYHGYTAYVYLKKATPQRAAIDKITTLFNRFDACERAKDCRQLRAEMADKLETFGYSELARKYSTVWGFIFDAVGSGGRGQPGFEGHIPPSFDPARIAGLCLNEGQGTDIETCVKFARASMHGFWFKYGNASVGADQSKYNALVNSTIRCSPPVDCSQVIARLRQLPNTTLTPQVRKTILISAFMSENVPDLLDEDGWYNVQGGLNRCAKSAGADPCKQLACLKSEMMFFMLHSVLTGNLLSQSNQGSGSADIVGRKLTMLNEAMTRFTYDPVKKEAKPYNECPQQ